MPDFKCLLYQVPSSHFCLILHNNLRGWTPMWNSQLNPAVTHWSSSSKQTADWVPSTYRTAQQESCLWDYCSYDWRSFERKTMSGKHREYFYLKPTSASLFSVPYHSPFSFLFMVTPVERVTIPDEREGRWMTDTPKNEIGVTPSEFLINEGHEWWN